ncbi:MAG: hypothetical protein WCO65_03440 [bacterium]
MEYIVIGILFSIFLLVVVNFIIVNNKLRDEEKKKKLLEIIKAHQNDQVNLFCLFLKKRKRISKDDILFLLFEISHVLRNKTGEHSIPEIHYYLFWELNKQKALLPDEYELIHSWYKDILYTDDVYLLVDLIGMNNFDLAIEIKKYYSLSKT